MPKQIRSGLIPCQPYDSRRDPHELPQDLTTRSLSLRLQSDGTPASLDEATRSVEVICSTENPVPVMDWERYEIVDEVLLMSGCQMPGNRQVPLLDTHYRGGIDSVLGSCRALRIEGAQLLGRAHYSEDEAAEKAWRKTREGHLTDYSIGYRVHEAYYVPEGEVQIIDGRSFTGPVKVATRWSVKELSTCPIGADDMAKARAATQPPTPKHEERTMPEKKIETPEKVEARGDQPTPASPALTEADVKRQAQEMARAEINRREEIRTMCDHFGLGEMARELIDGDKSLDEARAAVMAKQMEQPASQGVGFRAEVGADSADKFRAAAEDALVLRSGSPIAKPAAGALDLRGFSLREMAREALRVSGKNTGGDPMAMIGRALTTSDLPEILSNVANKSLFAGYEGAEETWDKWADTGSVSDFKTNTIARASETDDLDEIGESDEYKYGDLSDGKEQFALATYGKLFKISRQSIINDDLGALTDIPKKHGEAWARKVGDIAYAVLTANAAMGDGIALFHANHANLGGAGALSATTMAEAIKLMKLQKDIGGQRRLNIQPRFFLAPVALEGSAEVFFGSQLLDVSTGSQQINPYAGSRFERIYEARLDDDSATAYYLAGAKGKTVRVFFLNGQQGPYLETRNGWSVDGVEMKVRGDAAAKAMDWKALVKNAGA